MELGRKKTGPRPRDATPTDDETPTPGNTVKPPNAAREAALYRRQEASRRLAALLDTRTPSRDGEVPGDEGGGLNEEAAETGPALLSS